MEKKFTKDKQFYRFAMYGFLKNLRFFEPFLILFFRDMGMSFFQIGTLFSIREISTNILEIPTGIIADLYGRRSSMVFSMSSYIIAFLIFYFFNNFYLFMIAMIFFAMGEAFRTGTHKALILEYLRLKNMEDVKVHYYGATRSFSQLGSAVNSLIAACIVFYTGNYKVVFLAVLIPYVMNLINLATYPKELEGSGRKKKKETLKDFVSMFKSIEALRAIMNSASFDAFFKTVKEYLQPILKYFALSLPVMLMLSDKKRTAVVIGIVYFFIYLLTSYASRYAGVVSGRFRNLESAMNISYIFGALAIIFSGIFEIWKIHVLTIILFLFLYVFQNFRRPMAVAFISERIKHSTMASGLSVESQLKTIISAIMAPVMGFMVDKIGIGYGMGIFGMIMLGIFFFIKL